MRKLSVVIPCYNSEKNIGNVLEEFQNMFDGQNKWEYELILVNDCSKDNTIKVLKTMADKFKNVKVVDLVKNSGQHSAMLAGFKCATGELIATSDDDGQTPLENIMQLVEKIDEGYDVVCAKYTQKSQPSIVRRFGTLCSRKMMEWLIDKPKGIVLSTFFVARKVIIDEMVKYDQPYPFIPGLIARTTSKIANVEMKQKARGAGQSGYNFKKLLSMWLNGFTAFSIKPLRIASFTGFFCCAIGVLSSLILIIRKIIDPNILMGWSSIFCLLLIIGGLILCMLGLIGEYLGRIYMCINKTPQYVIREIYEKQ